MGNRIGNPNSQWCNKEKWILVSSVFLVDSISPFMYVLSFLTSIDTIMENILQKCRVIFLERSPSCLSFTTVFSNPNKKLKTPLK